MSDLEQQIIGSTATEKFELLDALWESLETESQVLTEAQRVELDWRVAGYEQDRGAVIA